MLMLALVSEQCFGWQQLLTTVLGRPGSGGGDGERYQRATLVRARSSCIYGSERAVVEQLFVASK